MTPKQKNLVQVSFTKVVPIADVAAELFYAKLFKLDPDIGPLFKGDMKEQGRKLMRMIATAVNGLDRLERNWCRRCRTWGGATWPTACVRITTIPSVPRSCGPWSKDSEPISHLKSKRPGSLSTACWPGP